jgi:prevent-host-death family protein
MTTIGAFEAKTHLSALLDRAAKGESFTITKHGMPVAVLAPFATDDQAHRDAAIERLRQFGRGRRLADDWKELRDAGRRY